MFFPKDMSMTSPSSIFSDYASMGSSIILLLSNAFRYLIKPFSSTLTLIIEESSGIARNQVYDAAEAYLSTKVSPANKRLKVSKSPTERKLTIRLENGEKITDSYEGFSLKWRFNCAESEKNNSPNDYSSISTRSVKRYFELSFHRKHKEMVLESYLPFILEKAKEMKDEERVLKIHTLNTSNYGYSAVKWDSINLEHPSPSETLAMESELKNAVMEDLNRFVKTRDSYKKVGRAWKRGYLLYGPPGTGKSSLIAAMANHLRFDIFKLQLGNIRKGSDLRKLLLATANRSILVIEDIDCIVDIPEPRQGDGRKQADVQDKAIDGWKQLTLSGLLNFIDGLWSSCGDERIIVFTTNHKERLDPALLRPGRMDMHSHMSYCTYQGFKLLASNYLEISSVHRVFGEIEGLIEETRIIPAQVANELMKSEDAEESLEGFVNLLKRKKMEGDVFENYSPDKAETHQQSKRRKVAGCKQKQAVAINKRNNGVTLRTRRRLGRGCSL